MSGMPILIEIDNKGKMTIDYVGFHGQECHTAEASIIKRLSSLKMRGTGKVMKEQFEDRQFEQQPV